MVITLIDNPRFDIALQREQEQISLLKKIQNVAFAALKYLVTFLHAIEKSFYKNFRYIGQSFYQYVLLGGRQINHTFESLVLITVIWVCVVAYSILKTANRLFWEMNAADTGSPYLAYFANDKIDISHIKSKNMAIDASHVPQEVTITQLRTLFDQINFTRPDAPGYMAPASRQGQSVETLSGNLDLFISRVQHRVPFLGTPPANDMPLLMQFYGQIEDAVRCSIHKVNKDIADFQGDHTSAAFANLLENRARVALDLSIAGGYCGARYMGEAMSVYARSQGMSDLSGETLEGTLIECLAKERKSIAERHVQAYVGDNTHDYTKYMQSMGKILGLPGTQGIIEHLDQDLNRDGMLVHFFEEYTPAFIESTIQNKVKTSGELREKICDWLKDQARDWKKMSMLRLRKRFLKLLRLLIRCSSKKESLL